MWVDSRSIADLYHEVRPLLFRFNAFSDRWLLPDSHAHDVCDVTIVIVVLRIDASQKMNWRDIVEWIILSLSGINHKQSLRVGRVMRAQLTTNADGSCMSINDCREGSVRFKIIKQAFSLYAASHTRITQRSSCFWIHDEYDVRRIYSVQKREKKMWIDSRSIADFCHEVRRLLFCFTSTLCRIDSTISMRMMLAS